MRISETILRYNIVKSIIITLNNVYFTGAIQFQMKTGV
jgi:hypothetical protein